VQKWEDGTWSGGAKSVLGLVREKWVECIGLGKHFKLTRREYFKGEKCPDRNPQEDQILEFVEQERKGARRSLGLLRGKLPGGRT